ncbi:hypothetical protein EDD73_11754 [Heliophilum fasciatum]|uniref:Uncharacterized protein n=1 Tax=Heliophilum fasciatum TaxID=35700 RepID=A0A4R2RLV6_9FIRM|nr:hypothetical protein [Heliophilum fasciatum]TCP63629.1 hypothetical protein EDD73_11754 [Heliophilum fasciatum]
MSIMPIIYYGYKQRIQTGYLCFLFLFLSLSLAKPVKTRLLCVGEKNDLACGGEVAVSMQRPSSLFIFRTFSKGK